MSIYDESYPRGVRHMFFDDTFAILVSYTQRKRAAVLSLLFIASGLVSAKTPLQGELRAAEAFELKRLNQTERIREVRVVVEARGELKANVDGKKVRKLPMVVKGQLHFDERVLVDAGSTRRSIRRYRQAEARIRIDQGDANPSVRSDRRLILAETAPDRILLACPNGPITREEWDLIRVQADPLALSDLLPEGKVSIGDSWRPKAERWSRLMALDAVSEAEVDCTLRKIEGDVAIIDLVGPISGAAGGVATDIEIKGKVNFHLRRGEINWFSATVKEKRAIGHAEPGLNVTARVRVAVSPKEAAPELADDSLAGLDLKVDEETAALRFRSETGSFELLHDARWRLMVDRPHVAVFRMVDRGDLIAQCNLSVLDDFEAGKQLTLEGFQRDIRMSLDKNFGQFVEAAEYVTDSKLRALRVMASGASQGLSIHWIYYHLSDDEGRRLSLAFTMETELVERFGAIDRAIVGSLEFLDRPAPRAALGPRPQR